MESLTEKRPFLFLKSVFEAEDLSKAFFFVYFGTKIMLKISALKGIGLL